jgi:hypothetical protein
VSGGSYNYLCFAEDVADLAEKRAELEQMHDRLAALPWARTAADETARLMAALDRIDSRVRNSKELREVWRAVEWWDSCDYSEKQAREAVRDYDDLIAPAPAAIGETE